MGLARQVAAFLEGGSDAPWARGLADAYGRVAAARLHRRAVAPAGRCVITVGGATLGGSGATPVAISIATRLAQHGHRVALVGHGYRAAAGAPRVVAPDASLEAVGDEALVASRAFAQAEVAVPVVVGSSRQASLAFAGALADVLVADGVLQLYPRRADLSVLVVAAGAPWGAGAPPPAGDLRAPVGALFRACDVVVAVGGCDAVPDFVLAERCRREQRQLFLASSVNAGARVDGMLVPWSRIANLRVGLLTALARPRRLLSALEARGVHPLVHLAAPDHGPVEATLRERFRRAPPLDLWLATAKCAPHWRPSAARNLAVIEQDIVTSSEFLALLQATAESRCPTRSFHRARPA